MYIRKNINSAGMFYFQLVASYREGKKVRQKILLSLGKKEEGKLDNLAEAVSRHTSLLRAEELAKKLDVKKTYILGPLLILERLFENLGINSTLEDILFSHPQIKFNLRKILFTMVSARFVQAGSKLKLFEHWQRVFLSGDVGVGLEAASTLQGFGFTGEA